MVAALLALVAAGCVTARVIPDDPATTAIASPPIDSALAVQTFDSAWSRIHNSYYDPAMRGIDWAAVRNELRPRAQSAATLEDLRGIIRDMLGRLGESHFALIPRAAVEDLGGSDSPEGAQGDAGMTVRWVADELAVTEVLPSGAAEAAGTQAGWRVDAIGERDVASLRAALRAADGEAAQRAIRARTLAAAAEWLRGSAGSDVVIRFRDGADEPQVLTVKRQPPRGVMVRFGNLPPMFAHLEHRSIPVDGGRCIGLIRFSVWMLPLSPEFDRAVDALAGCAGMIIDLRGNPGGVGGMVMGTAGSFFDERVPLGVMTTRQGEIRFVAMPRRLSAAGTPRSTYTAPLAVLVDEQSMSTSEIFAAGLQATGRARIFGTRTPGYALPALMLRLPTGDILYHAIANLTDPDGRRIEGSGVEPDVPVALTLQSLLAGRDAVLEAAVDWISRSPGG
jgi:carboxyl-terminal processing protease